jgi:uncharacterized protein
MKTIRGLLLAAASLAMAASAWAEDAVGKWTGTLTGTPQGDLPLVITVAKASDGKLSANLESPAQAPGMMIPATTIASDGTTLSFTVDNLQVSYSGKWDAAKKAWVGTFTQGGSLPLSLTRVP